ncbi:hypothetical protein, partial [uncultured Phascolarctobacterium sp.]|uniref:hypothetical protein n=1 Tax=uncultured Phascolarctobacterium sp. TaxID=512296 RepID=UPI0025DE2974
RVNQYAVGQQAVRPLFAEAPFQNELLKIKKTSFSISSQANKKESLCPNARYKNRKTCLPNGKHVFFTAP